MAEDQTATANASVAALATAGQDQQLRDAVLAALRTTEARVADPSVFRTQVRWPLIQALLSKVQVQNVTLQNGLIFEVSLASRIEQALLLSADAHPDHVWEPQTTKLLTALAAEATHVIVGGAYIGDQVLPIAQAMSHRESPGIVHAFEPMQYAHSRLQRNMQLNGLSNVIVHRLGLWDRSHASLTMTGTPALGTASQGTESPDGRGEEVESLALDDYVQLRALPSVQLIMLDTEGGEEKALRGATQLLSQPGLAAPHLIFEIHRNYVDWSNGLPETSIIKFITAKGYVVFAIRDFHDNYSMAGRPIEIIPADCVYLQGPPHGFNLLATKDLGLIRRLGLSVVEHVSPKLLLDKDPALHHPRDGMGLAFPTAALRRIAS
jgi:FkbM family methyltransferase